MDQSRQDHLLRFVGVRSSLRVVFVVLLWKFSLQILILISYVNTITPSGIVSSNTFDMNFKPKFTKKDSAEKKDAGAEYFEPITKYMATDLITFTPETNVIEVIRTFLNNKISGAPVLNEKKEVVGLIDDKDCLRLLIDSVYHNEPIANVKVQSYMTSVMKIIDVNANVVDAAKIFLETKYKRLLVINEDGKLIGQISRQDILEAIDTIYVPKWKSKT